MHHMKLAYRTSLLLKERQQQWLAAESVRLDISIADLIRRIIDEKMEKTK